MTGHGTDYDDQEWKALLRAHAPAPPFDEVDWTALHGRVTAAALPLMQHTRVSWWQHVAGWSMRGIPAAAATAALVMLLMSNVVRPADGGYAEFRTIEEELATALPAEGTLLLEPDDMADALIFYGVE